MTTKEIAQSLTEYCMKGDFDGAHEALYSTEAVSIEPYETPGFEKVTRGLKAIREKSEKWNSMIKEVKDLKIAGPLVSGNSFALTFSMQVIDNEGKEMDMKELCVYEVKDGKIVSEAFHV